jgi:hypothetical protein
MLVVMMLVVPPGARCERHAAALWRLPSDRSAAGQNGKTMQQLKAGAAAAARESRVNPRSIKEWKALGDGDLSKIRRLGDNATATAGSQSGQACEAAAGPRASWGAEQEEAAAPKKKRKQLKAASSSESDSESKSSSGEESDEDDGSEAKDTKAPGGAGESAAVASDEGSAQRKSEISESAAGGAGVAVQAQAQVLARSTRDLVARKEKETGAGAGCNRAAGGGGWKRGAGAAKAGGAAASPSKQVLSVCDTYSTPDACQHKHALDSPALASVSLSPARSAAGHLADALTRARSAKSPTCLEAIQKRARTRMGRGRRMTRFARALARSLVASKESRQRK